MDIVLKAKTQPGREALKTHVKNTTTKDIVIMRTLGVKQKLQDDKLIISINNMAIKIMKKRDPKRLKEYLTNEQGRLTDSIDMLGVVKNKDYTVEVLDD